MTSESGAEDPHLARFREIVAGLETDDIHATLDQVMGAGAFAVRRANRPDLRRSLPPQRQVITVRVDLHEATPPIWRRLELRSDLSLAEVHEVIQVAFDWADYHLWRFAAGGHPFDLDAQLFLCPFDVEEGEENGLPAGDVRLGELLQERGDRLGYVYDYGDDWDLRIVVESVRDAAEDAAPARAIGGRRAAPPEDCGGLRDAVDLAEVLEDPAHIDVDALDHQLVAGASSLGDPTADAGVPPLLAEPLDRLRRTASGRDLKARAALLGPEVDIPEGTSWDDALKAVTWFLEQAAQEGGIPLTGAGYLRPSVVEEASAVVPSMAHWIGLKNREVQCTPLLDFRDALQRAKILRKYKGALLPTRRALAAFEAGAVKELVLESLIPQDGFEHVASVLLLTHVATTKPGAAVPTGDVALALTELGWQVGHGPVPTASLVDLPAWQLLINVGEVGSRKAWRHGAFSPEAMLLAREALGR